MIREDLILFCSAGDCGNCQRCHEKQEESKFCCVCLKFGAGKVTDRCCHWCPCVNKDKRIKA